LELDFSELKVLTDLGLTLIQARLYLALVESGSSKILQISKKSQVARPDVYSNLSKLQEIGLAEKIVNKPITYRAIPIESGLSLLLEAKTEQYKKIRAETRILFDTAKIMKVNKEEEIEPPHFVLIPKGKTVLYRMRAAIEKAKLSFDFVLSWKRFSRGMSSTFAESIEIAWAKKVKIRFIVETPVKSNTAYQLVQYCREKPFCQIKFIPDYPETVFGILDKEEVFIISFSKRNLLDSPTLWSKNRSLVALAMNYFESLWKTATENI
jgi:sugar-specific transcriptional regulator TrmB